MLSAHSAPGSAGGKVVAPATKGGRLFHRPKGGWPVSPGRSPVVRFYSYRRRSRPPQPSAPQGPSNLAHRAQPCQTSGPRGPSTLTPKGETTHYDLCVALLLQIMFAVHAEGVSKRAPPQPFEPFEPSEPFEPGPRSGPSGRHYNPQPRKAVKPKNPPPTAGPS